MTKTFDQEYFDVLMEKATQEGADPKLMAEGKKALQFASPSKLKALMESTPEEFYKTFAEVVCSAALDSRTNTSKLASFVDKTKVHLGKDTVDGHGFFYNAVRYIAATLLGVVKFAWDATLLTGAFAVRFGIRLGKNVSKALVNTVVETKGDAKHYGIALKESFDRNILGKTKTSSSDENFDVDPVAVIAVDTDKEDENYVND